MKTKKALEILSRGETSPASPLEAHAERFVRAFDQREAHIAARQATDVVQLPFLDALRRKVSKMTDTPDNNLPVVGRYDLYMGVRKLAERSPSDNGLTRLVPHLEKLWQADPLGTLNYGEVRGLVGSIRDRYPRSKAADAVEAECTRVGLHKLPVAKLARVAGQITSQEDYDVAMEANGLAGDRPDQIRARALVRSLVEMRGASVDAHQPSARDERNVAQRVADRVQAEWEKPWLKKKDEGDEHEADDEDSESAEKEAQMEDGPPKPEKKGPPKPPNKSPGHEEHESPETEMLEQETGLEMGPGDEGDEPAMGAPAPEQAMDLVQEIDEAAQEIIEDAPEEAQSYIDHEMAEGHTAPPGTAEWGAEEILNEGHTAPPPTEEWLMEEMEELEGGGMPDGMEDPAGPMPGMDMPMGGPPGMGGPPMGGGLPPPGPGLMESAAPDMSMAPPSIPPVSIGEVRPKSPMMAPPKPAPAPGHFNRMRGEKQAAEESKKDSDGKGIPLPKGKIKQQIEVQTYAPKMSPSGGGKVLKSADIEGRLLTGEKLKVGNVSIFINKNDEVEVWNKGAGRACDLIHLDTAIADFVAMCRAQKQAREAAKLHFEFRIAEVINAPCEACGDMNTFIKAASRMQYGCPCGHEISAGLINELAELAHWPVMHKLEIRHAADQSIQSRIFDAMEKLTDENATLDEANASHIVATLHGLDTDAVTRLSANLVLLGGRKAQMGGGMGGGELSVPAGPPGGAPPPAEPGKPISGIIQDALQHYHNRGLGFMAAVAEMKKEYKERAQEFETPEADAMMLQLGSSLWGATGGGAGAPPGGAAPPSQPGSTTMMAALKFADSKMKTPAIRKPKDHVSVPDDLGPDSETRGSIPTPGHIDSQPNKTQHQKMSPKELGKDSETKDLMPDPGKPKAEHDPKSQPGVKLPEKGLDKDLEGKNPFKTPALGAEPKVNKSEHKE